MGANLILDKKLLLFFPHFCLGCSCGDACDKTEKSTDSHGPKVNAPLLCLLPLTRKKNLLQTLLKLNKGMKQSVDQSIQTHYYQLT